MNVNLTCAKKAALILLEVISARVLLDINWRRMAITVKVTYLNLSYDPYGPASSFFAKPLIKVPYEGRTHLRERDRKKPYGPTTKEYGLAC